MMKWAHWTEGAEAAIIDIHSALIGHSWKALDSLRDALSNLESAIETLEHEQEDRE